MSRDFCFPTAQVVVVGRVTIRTSSRADSRQWVTRPFGTLAGHARDNQNGPDGHVRGGRDASGLLAGDSILVPVETAVVRHRDPIELGASLERRDRCAVRSVSRAGSSQAVRILLVQVRAVLVERWRSDGRLKRGTRRRRQQHRRNSNKGDDALHESQLTRAPLIIHETGLWGSRLRLGHRVDRCSEDICSVLLQSEERRTLPVARVEANAVREHVEV